MAMRVVPVFVVSLAAFTFACSIRARAIPNDDSGTPEADASPDSGATNDAGTTTGDASNTSLWVDPNGCASLPLGAVGARFMGVAAYCQPPSGNGFYQCDELANRFQRDALSHSNLDNVVTEFASSMCASAASKSEYSVWGPGYGSTVGHSPAPGDLIVWSGSPGHVAVVVGVTPQAVRIMQQNALPVVKDLVWDSTTSFFSPSTEECWIHAESAPPATPPSGPSCGCFDGSGDYCGLSIVDHEWWYACTADVSGGAINYDTLYTCGGGKFTAKTTCPSSCVTKYMQPATGACGG